MDLPLAVQCVGISKRYKHFNLQDVDLSFEQGTVMGLVGPNGAGKSTILRIVMGLIGPDRGTVKVLGHAMPEDQIAAKRRIGFVAEDNHQDYIKTEILPPLKLTHTYGQLSEVNLADVASGYVVGLVRDMKPLGFTVAGGSMIATADDVGGFLRALNDGSLLTKEEQAIYSSVYVYEHTGLLPGYESIARYHKDTDTVVVVFVSTSGANSWGKIDAIESRVVRILRKR